MTRRRLAAAVAFLALVAGCGGDDDEKKATKTTTVSKTVTAATQATTTTGGNVPRAPARAPVHRVTRVTGFSSPSKNVGCFIGQENVRCDIRKRSWKPPRAPRSCDLDFGQGINLSLGREPSFVCAGDTALGPPTKLAYGTAIAAGVLRCDSKRSGMRCRDTKTGRGFTLSREGFDLF